MSMNIPTPKLESWQERNAAALAATPITVALIACGKSKTAHAAPARELYTSQLFRKSYAWALEQGNCDHRWIISAKHGLLSPLAAIAPYELSLHQLSKRERELWGFRVRAALFSMYAGSRIEFVFLAGAMYREAIIDSMRNDSPLWTWSAPLAHKGIGEQLAALTHQED